ncbi:MAG: hypothetical protein K2Y18_02295 [Alphaproteobacteria bacterium]|nr:hypothetical protein [Alphaproteobacteria bacterium]
MMSRTMRTVFIFFVIVFSIYSNGFAANMEALDHKVKYHLCCTSGARDSKLKEIISDPEQRIVGLNLTYATGLENPLALFLKPMPDLRFLGMKFDFEELLPDLPEKTPYLEVLDINGADIMDTALLTQLSRISSLRVLDISYIHSCEEMSQILEGLLSSNKNLTICVKFLRKRSPYQNKVDMTIYKNNPRIVLDTCYSFLQRTPYLVDPSVKGYIY